MAYITRGNAGHPGNGPKTVITKEIETIAKERMGEVDEPHSGVIAKHYQI